MDEEELHNRLNARITQVFDNYEDTTADEGWALLRQKFPKEKKDRGSFWLWYAAAAVVLLGIGFWFMQGPDQTKKPVAVNIKPIIPSKANQVNDSLSNKSIAQSQHDTDIAHPNSKPGVPGSQSVQGRQTIAHTGSSANWVAASRAGQQVKPNVPSNSGTINSASQGNYVATNPVTSPVNTNIATGNANPDSANKATQSIAQNNYKVPQNKPLTSAEAMAKLLKETAPLVKNNKDDKKVDKKAVIGLYAATYFNYAKGSDNMMNVGAGVSSDFRINNKLKLSTGLSIGQNTLNYGFEKVPPVSRSFAADNAYAVPSSTIALTANSYSYTSTPVNKNYKASLIGLDIPINIKYQFNPNKNDTYVSAGFSSGTFITETYVLDYTVAQRAEQVTVQSNFSNFYFAKTLNFSFGIGYGVGKSNRLIVEPFLKYPLDGLGLQQIKFGAGGINLKLNFTSPKK